MSSDLTSAGGGGGITALTGDVTASGSGSQAATIPDLVIGRPAYNPLQFDTSTSTLADVPGLTRTVAAATLYEIRVRLALFPGGAGGWKVALGGTSTRTDAGLHVHTYDDESNILANNEAVGFGGIFSTVTSGSGPTAASILIVGFLLTNGAGTLTVQFAQKTTNATASSIYPYSTLSLLKIAG